MNREAKPLGGKFKIAKLELGIFTEPFLIHELGTWIINKNFDGIYEDIKPAINLLDE